MVFTGCACEGDVVTVGALLLECFWRVEYSGLEVANEVARVSARKSSAQPRSVLLALRTWAKEVKGRNLICFIDQDVARQALAKAHSPS